MKNQSLTVLVLAIGMFAVSCQIVLADSSDWTIIQLTNNDYDEFNP